VKKPRLQTVLEIALGIMGREHTLTHLASSSQQLEELVGKMGNVGQLGVKTLAFCNFWTQPSYVS